MNLSSGTGWAVPNQAKKTLLFVYGSLLNPTSAANVLGREVQQYITAKLPRSRFVWGSPQKVRLIHEKEAFTAYSANILLHAEQDDHVTGMLIEVTVEELARLLIRENGYSLVNISQRLELQDVARAYVFADLRDQSSPGSPVMAQYWRRVMDGAAAQGMEFAKQFTAQIPVPDRLIEGEFEFSDIEHQRLV